MKNFNLSEKTAVWRVFVKTHPMAIYKFDDVLGEHQIKCQFLKGRKVVFTLKDKQCTLRVPLKCCWSLKSLQKWILSLDI